MLKVVRALCWLSLIFLHSYELTAQENFGNFHGDLIVKALPDGRKLQLTHPLSFIDPVGKLWAVPTGAIVDGASIPQAFWSIIGGPFEDKYREASVVHDYFCDEKIETWQNVHLVFYNAMRARGVTSLKAKLMYAAVYNFGPRWIVVSPMGSTALISGRPILQLHAKEAIIKFITEHDPSISVINELSDKLSSVDNIEQLEKILYENVGCTPILASTSDGASDVKRTLVLCGLNRASQKQAAISNLRNLSLQLTHVLGANIEILAIVNQYTRQPTLENWEKLKEWSRNAYGLVKVAMRSVLDVQDERLQAMVPSIDGLYQNLTTRAAMIAPILTGPPKTVEDMRIWGREYQILVYQLRDDHARNLMQYLASLPN